VRQEEPTFAVPPRKVVKTIHVGQEVEGTVKRVTDFGAFVDIGVGRDGLVHVSEMSAGRVA
jgi:ribosomal protein S1